MNKNQLYVWGSFTSLLAAAFLQRYVMLSATQGFRAQYPGTEFHLMLPLGLQASGLWWLFALPAIWFVVALADGIHPHPDAGRA